MSGGRTLVLNIITLLRKCKFEYKIFLHCNKPCQCLNTTDYWTIDTGTKSPSSDVSIQ